MNLTYWGRVTHRCASRLTITGSNNGLSHGPRQAIIWTNAGILLIGSLGTNFSENLIEILTFSFTKMRLKVSSAKRRPFCLGLNVLITHSRTHSRTLPLTHSHTRHLTVLNMVDLHVCFNLTVNHTCHIGCLYYSARASGVTLGAI